MFIIPDWLQMYSYSTAWPQFQRQDKVLSAMSLLLIIIICNSKYFAPRFSDNVVTNDNSSAPTYHKDNDMVYNSFVYMLHMNLHMNLWWHSGYPYYV